MDEVIHKLVQWATNKKAPPDTVQIYPTNKCNLKCIFCYQRLEEYDFSDIVTKDRWFEITREICEMGTKGVLVSGGGEPLCVPEVTFGIMEIVKSHGLRGRMINNGTLWTEETIKKTIEMGWDNIMFSIDGPNAEIHDYLRGANGCFNKAINNIILFNDLKKRLKKDKPILELTTVLCKKNYREINGIIDLANSLSIKQINIEPICVNCPESQILKLNEEERKEFFKEIIPFAQKNADKYKIHTNFKKLKEVKYIEKTGELKDIILNKKESHKKFNENSNNPFLDLPCYEPWLWPKIEANGEVWPCSTVSLKTNIREKAFKKIWFGNQFQNFRKRIIEKNLPKECSNCVATHIPRNREMKEKLKKLVIKDERKNKKTSKMV